MLGKVVLKVIKEIAYKKATSATSRYFTCIIVSSKF